MAEDKDKKWTIQTDVSLKVSVVTPSLETFVKIAPILAIFLNYLI
ncbi:hypothetical protein [Salinicoccus roseus]|nr:hypothetical protein [Salinicoccus roseus]